MRAETRAALAQVQGGLPHPRGTGSGCSSSSSRQDARRRAPWGARATPAQVRQVRPSTGCRVPGRQSSHVMRGEPLDASPGLDEEGASVVASEDSARIHTAQEDAAEGCQSSTDADGQVAGADQQPQEQSGPGVRGDEEEDRAQMVEVETVATSGGSHATDNSEGAAPETPAGSALHAGLLRTVSVLAQPMEGIQSAATAITSAQLTPVSVMLVLVMSTFTALGAAMYAVIKIMQPSLKATERAAKAMELAAKDLQTAAQGMKQTSDMFQADVPVLFADLQTTSKEFSELGQTLNVVSGGWVGAPKSSKSKKQDGPEKEGKPPSRSNGAAPSSSARPSAAGRPSSVRDSGGGGARAPPARSSLQPAKPYQGKQQKTADEENRQSSGDSVGEEALEPRGWYGGTVSTLMRMTRDVNKLGDVISPTVSGIRDQIGGLARVFNSKYRAEEERRGRAESAQQWISDWRTRTGVKYVTVLPPSPTVAKSPEVGSPSKSDAPQTDEEKVASLSATAVFDQSFEEPPENEPGSTSWLGWEADLLDSWDGSAEPMASGFDISYKDIINSAEELALAGGSHTAASHLLGKLMQDPEPTSTLGPTSDILMSVDDDDDYFDREAYVDNVTPVDERLLPGSDIAVTRLHRRKPPGSSAPRESGGGPASNPVDRERKRQA